MDAFPVPETAASMSRLMIRPPGPLPVTRERSSPFSSARRLASGLDSVRPPFAAGAAGAGAGATAGRAGADGGAAGGAGAAVGVETALAVVGSRFSVVGCAAAGFAAPAPMTAAMSSSFAAITPTSVPTGTASPSFTRRLRFAFMRAQSSITGFICFRLRRGRRRSSRRRLHSASHFTRRHLPSWGRAPP